MTGALIAFAVTFLVGGVVGFVLRNEVLVRQRCGMIDLTGQTTSSSGGEWDWPGYAPSVAVEQPVTEEAVERAYTTIEYGPNGQARAVTYGTDGRPYPASTRG